MRFNCNGVADSHHQLDAILHKHSILVACIQESKLRPSSTFSDFPFYTAIRRDRPNGSGLITLVHSSINYIPLPTDHLFPNDSITEHLAITATINDHPVNIYNIYIPPPSSCPPGFSPSQDLLFQTQGDSLILGDFNAYHPTWFSSTSDSSAATRETLIHDAHRWIPTWCSLTLSKTPAFPHLAIPPPPTSLRPPHSLRSLRLVPHHYQQLRPHPHHNPTGKCLLHGPN